MAIGFARIEFIKRSEGRNTCQISSYLSRSKILFEGNLHAPKRTYDFSHREPPIFKEILVPNYCDQRYTHADFLWNAVEKKEVRKDAQVALHLVLALPDDSELSVEDRITLARTYVKKHYVDKGVGAEVVIHPPERKVECLENDEELSLKKGEKLSVLEQRNGKFVLKRSFGDDQETLEVDEKNPKILLRSHNWHAHVLLATRRFKENGKEFDDMKANDLLPVVRKGKVISGPNVGKLWAEHQNAYFISKGLSLRVDENGIVAQEHLGPFRLRGKAFDLLDESDRRFQLNSFLSRDPQEILKEITKSKSIFTQEDVERFLVKHVPHDIVSEVKERFWNLKELIQLRSKRSYDLVLKYTAKWVIEEERRILRLADRINQKTFKKVSEKITNKFIENLSQEQIRAYHNVLKKEGVVCIEGYAGAGKSFLLRALKNSYESSGLVVRAFGPDNATAEVLKNRDFDKAENVYRFLYCAKYGSRKIHKGREVWFLDEAGKLGNKPLLEFLKIAENRNVKVILSGDSAQLPSVERGGIFKVFCQKYGSEVLEEVHRQKCELEKEAVRNLARGEIGEALDKLVKKNAIKWSSNRKEAMENLIFHWGKDTYGVNSSKLTEKPGRAWLILAGTNDEIRVFNEMVRSIRKERGEIGVQEFQCATAFGKIYVSQGDRIEFRKNDKELGIINGTSGILTQVSVKRFIVEIERKGKKKQAISFNPKEFPYFQLGYASTCYRAQGRTVNRAYVMHSPFLNKQMAYVSLTRHIDQVSYFVSKDEALNLADLKFKALRDNTKSTTLEYVTTKDLYDLNQQREKKESIQILKESKKTSDRFKGTALELLGHLQEKINNWSEGRKDLSLDDAFYSYTKETSPLKGTISPVQELTGDKQFSQTSMTNSTLDYKEFFERDEKHTAPIETKLKELSSDKRKLVGAYFDSVDKVKGLKAVLEAEQENSHTTICGSQLFPLWQDACRKRNENAYHLKNSLGEQERDYLSQQALSCINNHAKKHEVVLTTRSMRLNQESKYSAIDNQLQENIDPLLRSLFPSGPTNRSSKELRFGSKGSLVVNYEGKFFDFENQKGGGLLQLIQNQMGLSKQEARDWAKNFLGGGLSYSSPVHHYSKPSPEWVSLKPGHTKAPDLKEMGAIHHYFKEVSRHAYRDYNGELLYYVLRLENHEGKKITPPLSYGNYVGESSPYWKLKGFSQGDKRTLYNLSLITQQIQAPLLVVEGEKAADAAFEKMEALGKKGFVVLTWPGGAGAVEKADWSALSGRDVLIWPDNDVVGFKAASSIEKQLLKVGAKSICSIDRNWLQANFEKGWDLADPWPSHLSKLDIINHSKGVAIHRLRDALLKGSFASKKDFVECLFMGDIAVNYLAGLQLSSLKENELQNINSSFFQKEGLKLAELIKQEKEQMRSFRENPHINAKGDVLSQLTRQCILFEVKHQRTPTLSEILLMKEAVQEGLKALITKPKISCSKNEMILGKQRVIQNVCEKTLSQKNKGHVDQYSLQKEFMYELKHIHEIVLKEKEQQASIHHNRGLERSIAYSASINLTH